MENKEKVALLRKQWEDGKVEQVKLKNKITVKISSAASYAERRRLCQEYENYCEDLLKIGEKLSLAYIEYNKELQQQLEDLRKNFTNDHI